MEKASPINMRRSLKIVDAFRKAGIGFVPIPVFSEEAYSDMLYLCNNILESSAEKIEQKERQDEMSKMQKVNDAEKLESEL